MTLQLHPRFDRAAFLRDFWQKKPVLIRQAFVDPQALVALVGPDELAGLACEEGVEARLILEKGGRKPWQLRHGPFTAQDFAKLPASHWSLLVQAVDQLLPEVADLRAAFRFVPDWRLDDVMISYSPDQGSVGAHLDHYDVFLIQGMGKRRWQIEESPRLDDDDLQEGVDLRLLKTFEPSADWVLEPGDMLYLPPRFAHLGVSLGEGMTLSVGFRSPSHADMLAQYCDQLLASFDESMRYTDADLSLQKHPGEIAPTALAKVVRWLQELPRDEKEIGHWFGRLVTRPRHEGPASWSDAEAEEQPAGLDESLSAGRVWRRNEGARLAFLVASEGLALFVNGHEYLLPLAARDLVERLCGDYCLRAEDLLPFQASYGSLLAELWQQGVFYPAPEDD